LNDQLPDEFSEWRQHPMTVRFFNYLFLVEESAKEDWALEQFVGSSLEEMALKNAKALGGVSVLRQLNNVNLEGIIEAEKERNEQVRNQGGRLDGTR
jgi:hypothetical protein